MDAGLQHVRDAGNAGGKLHIRDRAVADAGAGVCQKLKLLIIQVDAVRKPDIRSEPAEALHIRDRPQPEVFECETLFILCLAEMRVEPDMTASRQLRAFPEQV